MPNQLKPYLIVKYDNPLRKGLIKRIVINRHSLAYNRKHGTNRPCVSVQTSSEVFTGQEASIKGDSKVIHSPGKPLKCGAEIWIETRAEVELK